MKVKKAWVSVGAVLGAQLATGCGTAAPSEGTSGPSGSAIAPAGPAAKAVVAPEKPSAPLLFKDPNISGLRLDVYEVGGNPVVAVRGPIDTALPNLHATATLAEIYGQLHPNETVVPSALAPLDARLAPSLKAIASATPTAASATPTANIEKDWNGFASNFCITVPAAQDYWWQVRDCEYSNSYEEDWTQFPFGRVHLGGFFGYGEWDYFPLQRGDGMVAFNNTDYATGVWFTDPSGNFLGSPIFTDAYSWAFLHNYGPGPYGAIEYEAYYQYHIDNGFPWPSGEVGLTQHRVIWAPVVK